MNNRLDGNVDALKKGISFLEQDINSVKKVSGQYQSDMSPRAMAPILDHRVCMFLAQEG